jgi:hypothetical protein
LLRALTPESAQGKRTDLQPRVAGYPKSRKEVAKGAGLSSFQQKTALRVANVPDEQFEEMVERENPASVKKEA